MMLVCQFGDIMQGAHGCTRHAKPFGQFFLGLADVGERNVNRLVAGCFPDGYRGLGRLWLLHLPVEKATVAGVPLDGLLQVGIIGGEMAVAHSGGHEAQVAFLPMQTHIDGDFCF